VNLILPPPRRIPVVPRPRHGELSGSYLARIARANETDLRTFAGLLGSLPSLAPAEGPDLAVMVLTLNDAAFARLLAYTGLDGSQLSRAIPSLKPRTFRAPGESPAIRISFLRTLAADCPGCRIRRDGAHADTRVFPHKTACLRHGYWLYGQGGRQRVDLAALPEVAAAQRHLDKIAARRGPTAAMRAYDIASGYLQHSWRIDYHPYWYPALMDRWQQRVRTADALPGRSTWQLPGWAVHPECTALAAVFASPFWAALAIPMPDRRHRFFYLRLLTELMIDNASPLRTMRIFDPLPREIQEQARWGRLLGDPEWGAPPPATAIPKTVPFIDITDDYERSIGRLLGTTWPAETEWMPS
jgi:TniQ